MINAAKISSELTTIANNFRAFSSDNKKMFQTLLALKKFTAETEKIFLDTICQGLSDLDVSLIKKGEK